MLNKTKITTATQGAHQKCDKYSGNKYDFILTQHYAAT
jgi:hypothetical protein